MAMVSLREYNREIGSLIDRGQTDEAIAHCQHILATYPKHLDTYRLLGKAYLESQQSKEALDIFQRVLSVAPDDFVTHLGMSIIRGVEGNLDAAIWHMERAFEVQPANQTVQEELRRLYGQRDGVEPTKIRLTTGALIRMWGKGLLYTQAISEINQALSKQSDRIDLEVYLATMLFQSGNKSEAEKVSRSLLERFPFCYEANRILANLALEANKKEEAKEYIDRIIALDPYEAYLSSTYPRAADVPDDLIMIEKITPDLTVKPTTPPVAEPKPAIPEEEAPDWLISDLSQGVEQMGEKGFTRMLDPDALESEAAETIEEPAVAAAGIVAAAAAVVEPEPTVEETPTTATQPVQTTYEEETLPGWVAEQPAEEKLPVEDQIPDWMKQTGWAPAGTIDETAPPTEVYAAEESPIPARTGALEPDALPEWVQELAPKAGSDTTTAEEPAVELPSDMIPEAEEEGVGLNEWLTGLQESDKVTDQESPSAPVIEPPPVVTTIFDQQIGEPTAEPAEEMPDWMKNLGTASAAGFTPEPVEEPKPDQTLEEQIEEDAVPTGSLFGAPSGAGLSMPGGTAILSPDAVPDWIQELGDSEDEGKTTQPETAAVPPQTINLDEIPPEGVVTAVLPPEAAPGEMPEWLAEIQKASPEASDKITAVLPESETEEETAMPSWLRMLDEPEPTIPTTPLAKGKDTANIHADLGTSELKLPESEMEEEKPTTTILPPNPEDQAQELPSWLRELDTSSEGTSPTAEGANPPADSTDWATLSPAATNEPEVTPADVLPHKADEELPSWLNDLKIGEGPVEDAGAPDLPEWLQSLKTEQTTPVPKEIPYKDELPEWLQSGSTDNAAPEPPPIQIASIPVEEIAAGEPPAVVEETIVIPEQPEMETPLEESQPVLEEIASAVSTPAAEAAAAAVESVTEAEIPAAVQEMETEAAPTPPVADFEAAELDIQPEPLALEIETPVETETESMVADALAEVLQPQETLIAEEPASTEEEVVELVAEGSPAEAIDLAPIVPVVPEEVSAIEPVEPVLEAPTPEASEVPIIPVEEKRPPHPKHEKRKTVVEPVVESVSLDDAAHLLENARVLLSAGDLENASQKYVELIETESYLNEIIHDVSSALDTNPNDFSLWQTLGDAYGRAGKLQKALDAYIKAEENLI